MACGAVRTIGRALKRYGYFGLGTAAPIFANILVYPVLQSTLSADVAKASLTLCSVGQIMAMLITLGVPGPYIRDVTTIAYDNAFFHRFEMACGGILCLVLALSLIASGLMGEPLLFAISSAALYGQLGLVLAALRARRRGKSFAVAAILTAVLVPVSTALAVTAQREAAGLLAAAVWCFQFWLLTSSNRARASVKHFGRDAYALIREGVTVVPHIVALTSLTQLVRIHLGTSQNEHAVQINVVVTVAAAAPYFVTALSQILTADFFLAEADARRRTLRIVSSYAPVVVQTVTLGLALATISAIDFDSATLKVVQLGILLAAASGLQVLYSLSVNFFFLEHRLALLSRLTTSAVVVGWGFGALSIEFDSLPLAGVANVMSWLLLVWMMRGCLESIRVEVVAIKSVTFVVGILVTVAMALPVVA